MEDYVRYIYEYSVLIVAKEQVNLDVIRELGGKPNLNEADSWRIEFDNEDQLARILQRLRDAGMAFVGGPGWPPAGVADMLREKGKIQGTILEITWTGPDSTIIREK